MLSRRRCSLDGEPVSFATGRGNGRGHAAWCPRTGGSTAWSSRTCSTTSACRTWTGSAFRLGAAGQRTALAATDAERLQGANTGLGQPVGLLSGGNQQKVVLGKWLACAGRAC